MYDSDGRQGYGYDYQRRPQPQVQLGGMLPVHSETEARRYPMAPYTKMVFINIVEHYLVYVKTRYGRDEPEEFRIYRDVNFFPPQQQSAPQQQPVQQPVSTTPPAPQQPQPYDPRAEMAALEKRIDTKLDALTAMLTAKGGTANEQNA